MGALQLLPGETEALHLHPAPSTYVGRQVLALSFALGGGLLWQAFHAAWWTGNQPSDWTAPWTWLWGTRAAAYGWTLGGLALGGALASLPRGPWRPVRTALVLGVAICLAVRIWIPSDPETALPIVTAALTLPALAWQEFRRLATHYHITNLRLVARTAWPRTEQAVLYTELVDLDASVAPWPDTGTLLPITARPPAGLAPSPPLRMPGIRPLRRVRKLVEVLARRATAPEPSAGLDHELQEALAALQRP